MTRPSRITAAVLLSATATAPSSTAQEGAARPALSDTLETQILLAHNCFSPGEVDGMEGANTSGALAAFQSDRGLEMTRVPDDETLAALREGADGDSLVEHLLTAEDLGDPVIESIPEETMEKAELEALHYTSRREALGERFHVGPELLSELNPEATWEAGAKVWLPALGAAAAGCAAGRPVTPEGAELRVEVNAAESSLRLLADDELVYYAPVTAGSERDPLPEGAWTVRGVFPDPTFHYNPELFWDSEPGDEKVALAPGPNNPVGRVWIDLDKEHYGLHGTPEPGQVGHTQSHGCVRLTNWDALAIAEVIDAGTPVAFRSE